MLDNYGRKINYLRISVTDLCNLRCCYCMPAKGIPKKEHKEILRLEEIEGIARAAVKLGLNKIRITGGEPLIRKGIVELVHNISNIQGIKDLGLTTNGILLKNFAHDLKKAGLDRVNISIDSLAQDRYQAITRGGKAEDVWAGIEAARQEGLIPLKLNVVLIGGFNDDEIEDFVNLTLHEDIEVRFIELMPLGETRNWDEISFLPNSKVLETNPRLIPLPFKGHGSTVRLYKLPNSKGKVGLISAVSSHFCSYCNRIRLTADGKLKPCLHSGTEIDFRNYGIKQADKFLLDGIKAKPIKHNINQGVIIPESSRNMNEIGG